MYFILNDTSIYALYNWLLANLRTNIYIQELKRLKKNQTEISQLLNLWNKKFLINKSIRLEPDNLKNLYIDLVWLDKKMKSWKLIWTEENDFKLEFLQIILDKNADIFLFKKLEFYVLSRVYSGSRIPRLRYAISQNELILNYLKNKDQIKYLEHINYVEKEIFNKKISIEWERKREFINKMGWWFIQ